jgi:undecaprenyl pyrophosphate phosphatase UppP
MNLKKYLEKRIHGWLPKETNLPSCQRSHNHKAPKIGIQIGIVTFIMGFVGGILGAIGYSLGLFFGVEVYVWLIVTGIAIVAATILIRTKQKKEQQRS